MSVTSCWRKFSSCCCRATALPIRSAAVSRRLTRWASQEAFVLPTNSRLLITPSTTTGAITADRRPRTFISRPVSKRPSVRPSTTCTVVRSSTARAHQGSPLRAAPRSSAMWSPRTSTTEDSSIRNHAAASTPTVCRRRSSRSSRPPARSSSSRRLLRSPISCWPARASWTPSSRCASEDRSVITSAAPPIPSSAANGRTSTVTGTVRPSIDSDPSTTIGCPAAIVRTSRARSRGVLSGIAHWARASRARNEAGVRPSRRPAAGLSQRTRPSRSVIAAAQSMPSRITALPCSVSPSRACM